MIRSQNIVNDKTQVDGMIPPYSAKSFQKHLGVESVSFYKNIGGATLELLCFTNGKCAAEFMHSQSHFYT